MPLLLLVALLLNGCADSALVTGRAPSGQEVWVPMAGTPRGLFTRICRPPGEGPFRVVIINHGSPPAGSDRLQMQPQRCDAEAASWFLNRDFLVLFPMRRGFGATGGPLVESSGSCDSPDYVASGLAGAEDIAAVVAYATARPEARPDDAVVVGQSLGGWAVVAYDSLPHPAVGALISMAGGRGAWAGGQSGVNCRPDLLTKAAARFAAGASTPMLWIYARNDSYFPPPLAEELARAYTGAGGRIEFLQPEPFTIDGHFLFYGHGGSKVWGQLFERYLDERRAGS